MVHDVKWYIGRHLGRFAGRAAGHAVWLIIVEQYEEQSAGGSEAEYLALGTMVSVLYHLR